MNVPHNGGSAFSKLSVRDHFAALAMQAHISAFHAQISSDMAKVRGMVSSFYEWADIMMVERAKKMYPQQLDGLDAIWEHEKEWVRHTPGGLCPVDPMDLVDCIVRSKRNEIKQHQGLKAGRVLWSNSLVSGCEWETIGWRKSK